MNAHDDYAVLEDGTLLDNVHSAETCTGPCVLHNPSDHHMRSWRLLWRNDRGIFERICPTHGCGHPDPDQFDYWRRTRQDGQGIHGCCGCCRAPGALVAKKEPLW